MPMALLIQGNFAAEKDRASAGKRQGVLQLLRAPKDRDRTRAAVHSEKQSHNQARAIRGR